MYPFRYCTIKDVREYMNSTDNDEKILSKIELWSHTINEFTGKWFVPVYFDGKKEQLHDNRFVAPGFTEILEMSKPVEVSFSRRGINEVEFDTEYIYSDSEVFTSLNNPTVNPTNLLYKDIDVVGYFGNIQRNRSKVTTTVDGSVAIGAENIKLDSINNIVTGDILLIDNYISAIVVEVCSNNIVAVDPLAEGIEDESEVIVYGKMLPDIIYCLNELVSKKGFGIEEQRNLRFQQALIEEQTDDYMYRLESNYSKTSSGTGVLEVDRILERYRETVDIRLI